MKAALPAFRAAFEDFELEVSELVAAGDLVANRVTWRATHTGELMGIPASGNRVEITATHIARVTDGQIVERWGNWDQMGLMQQIGAIPAG